MLGEQQHSDIRHPAADLDCRAQPVVGVSRRHTHVSNDHVRMVSRDLAKKVIGIAGLGDHVKPVGAQQLRQALA